MLQTVRTKPHQSWQIFIATLASEKRNQSWEPGAGRILARPLQPSHTHYKYYHSLHTPTHTFTHSKTTHQLLIKDSPRRPPHPELNSRIMLLLQPFILFCPSAKQHSRGESVQDPSANGNTADVSIDLDDITRVTVQ